MFIKQVRLRPCLTFPESTRRVQPVPLSTHDFDLGIGEAQPLIRAYRADYRLQATVIQSEYDLNVALAELALVLGDMSSYLTWVADGQIALD